MTFEVEFLDSALKEWRKLDANTRAQFTKKLAERCRVPRISSAKPRGSQDRYKIKLRDAGYRLVCEVIDQQLIVLVITVGRRDRSEVYEAARKR